MPKEEMVNLEFERVHRIPTRRSEENDPEKSRPIIAKTRTTYFSTSKLSIETQKLEWPTIREDQERTSSSSKRREKEK